MTEQQHTPNLPAVVRRAEIAAPADTDSWTTVVGEVAKLAQYVADTDFVPRALRGNAPAAAAAILYGREVGLPPMTALNGVHIVEGAPSLAAEQMRSLVLAAGHDLEFVETTGTICRVRGRRRGSETWTPVEWTIDMARAAGLTTKNNWKNYPRRMLQARASSELCELVFPDVIHGFRSLEAQQDTPAEDEAGAAAAAPRATTRVRRTRTAPAATEKVGGTPGPAPAVRPADRRSGPAIPLPGEDGYDSGKGPESDPGGAAAAAPSPPETGGDVTAPDSGPPHTSGPVVPAGPADESDPAVSGGAGSDSTTGDNPVDDDQDDEPGDVVDAEIVGETPPPAQIGGIRPAQNRMILAKLSALGLKGDDTRPERLRLCGMLIGRPIESSKDLTKDEASTLIDTLALCASLEQLVQVAEQTAAAEHPDDGA